jgi:hypothetical protein
MFPSIRLTEGYEHQKPDLVSLDAQTVHGTHKANNALEFKGESAKTEENLAQKWKGTGPCEEGC